MREWARVELSDVVMGSHKVTVRSNAMARSEPSSENDCAVGIILRKSPAI